MMLATAKQHRRQRRNVQGRDALIADLGQKMLPKKRSAPPAAQTQQKKPPAPTPAESGGHKPTAAAKYRQGKTVSVERGTAARSASAIFPPPGGGGRGSPRSRPARSRVCRRRRPRALFQLLGLRPLAQSGCYGNRAQNPSRSRRHQPARAPGRATPGRRAAPVLLVHWADTAFPPAWPAWPEVGGPREVNRRSTPGRRPRQIRSAARG